MGNSLTVRQLRPDDWQLFARLRLECLGTAPEAFASRYETWQHATPEQWRSRLLDVPANWAAMAGSTPIGLISGSLDGDGSAELMSMYVSPTGRGRGTGDLLISTMVGWSGRQPGVHRVGLGVYENNDRAQKLYLRNGFSFDAPATGNPAAERRMTRWLQSPSGAYVNR
ncbi:GNAT family N-acetyltransferase [Kineosporia sp. J2-2]|uniref:GNAT family N-acetyltransferase n=1 Tax=Kineosporia corallincola TaxID=2835133 RepID=A0ABS5TFM7_9ACTN|nr:GNAT family N-acetyltransferase [Kineosporia corallincola]MBT0769001.1 GNAT family N-acetyltransferase [Kineosporia corallincola]